jgi:hypothetical protein
VDPVTARHVLGLVVEEAEVLHARVLLAAALAGGVEAGSGNGSGGGGTGLAAAPAGNDSAAATQYKRLAAVAEKLLAEWQCVIHSLIGDHEYPAANIHTEDFLTWFKLLQSSV